MIDAVRLEASRSGRSEDQVVEAAVRRYIGPNVIDRLRERNRLDEDEAMAITHDEVAAHRQDVTKLSPLGGASGHRQAIFSHRRHQVRRDRFRSHLSLEEVDEYVGEIERLCRMIDDPDQVPSPPGMP